MEVRGCYRLTAPLRHRINPWVAEHVKPRVFLLYEFRHLPKEVQEFQNFALVISAYVSDDNDVMAYDTG